MNWTRKHERHETFRKARWDFFAAATGMKPGFISNLSEGGCLLKTGDLINHRRWIRLMIQDTETNLVFSATGRVIRREDRIEAFSETDVTLHRYGVEFTQPFDLILALSSRNLTVRSCLSRNTMSSLRSGFFA